MHAGAAYPVERAVDLGLDRLVLEHRLGDEIAIGEIVERGRRAYPAERRLLVLRLEEAARDAAVEHRREPVFGRRELFVGAVRQHDIVSGEREHERDLRPHQPGADNADFFCCHVKTTQFAIPAKAAIRSRRLGWPDGSRPSPG